MRFKSPNCRLFFKLLGLCLSATTLQLAHAQESATVLPKGISRTRFVSVFAFPVTHSFDGDGNKVEIMNALNTTVPVSTLAQADAGLKNLYDKLNLLESGLGDELFQSKLEAKGQISGQRYVTAYEYGVSSKLSLGIIMPIITYQARAYFKSSNQDQIDQIMANKIAPMGAAGDALAGGLKTLADNLPNTATFQKAVFTDKGYKVPQASNGTGIGDIEAGIKYRVVNWDAWSSTIQTGFRLPTGTLKKDYTNLLSQTSGDGQLDYAIQNQNEFYVTRTTTVGVSNKVTWQFANNQKMPVPSYGQSGLTDLTNPNNFDRVHRDLGDDLDSEISLSQSLAGNRLKPYVAYQYWLHGQDSYSGSKNLNYGALQSGTNASAHYFETGVTVTTIPSVVAKTAKIPIEMKISYNKKIAGKNSADVSYTRFDVYLFF